MIRFLLQISQGARRYIFAIIAVGITDVALTLLFVWSSKELVDIATGESQRDFLFMASLFAIQVLFQILLRSIEVRITSLAEVKVANSLRNILFEHLLHAEWHPVSALNRGDTLTRMIKDTDDLVRLLTKILPLSFTAILQLCGAVVFFFILDWRLALILTIAMPLLLLISRIYYFPMKRYTKEVKESESSITSHVEESMANQLVIKTFELQDQELEKLNELQIDLHGKVDRKSRISFFARAIAGMAFQGGYLLAFVRGAYGLATQTITFGTLTAFLQLVGRIQRPLFELTRLIPGIISAKTATERLRDIIGIERETVPVKNLLQGPLSLVIKELSYSYTPGSRPVINNLSFTLNPGEMVAIMGETGVGKTTLARLLLGLVKPDKGSMEFIHNQKRITIDATTRSNFVYVPQEKLLFKGTIRDNLLMGNAEASEVQLRQALETASATFAFMLPNGLDTIIGEGGFGLSEGEAQRISIARSLLRPGRILLLDESSSSLDYVTEQAFLSHLKKNLNGRSVIFITHHKEVAAQCDMTIRFSENNRVRGGHISSP